MLRITLIVLIAFSSLLVNFRAMSYDEPTYKIIKKTSSYEIRLYDGRTVAQTAYSEESIGFKTLFKYISGYNKAAKEIKMTTPVTQGTKIDMTIPVSQTKNEKNKIMRFFLPKKYSKTTAPEPINPDVEILDLPQTYYAVISYSGFASDENFEKNTEKLEASLDKDGVMAIGPPIKATYNSPFTLPFLRRNEAMLPLKWE